MNGTLHLSVLGRVEIDDQYLVVIKIRIDLNDMAMIRFENMFNPLHCHQYVNLSIVVNMHLFHCLESAEVASSLVALSEHEVEAVCLCLVHTLCTC